VTGQVLRVGGDESIGKGLLWCRLNGPGGSP
jgi:CRISPR/Cas system CMR subunit Cmr4 (Cas7 group RAMP superfamily)